MVTKQKGTRKQKQSIYLMSDGLSALFSLGIAGFLLGLGASHGLFFKLLRLKTLSGHFM